MNLGESLAIAAVAATDFIVACGYLYSEWHFWLHDMTEALMDALTGEEEEKEIQDG